MSGTALPTAGRFRFVASDRTGRPWITLFVLRGVHQTGSGSLRSSATAHAGTAFLRRGLATGLRLAAESSMPPSSSRRG